MSGAIHKALQAIQDMGRRDRLEAAIRKVKRPRHHVCETNDAGEVICTRSPEWHAWRERQALAPVPQYRPVRPAPPTRQRTAAELRARRDSTRGKRARADRAEKLAERAR